MMPEGGEPNLPETGPYISKEHWHFHRQLFLRYGVILAPGQFSQIIADIRRGRARLVKAKGKRGSIYSIRIREAGGRVYVFAIDNIPITAWPLKAAKRLVKRGPPSRLLT